MSCVDRGEEEERTFINNMKEGTYGHLTKEKKSLFRMCTYNCLMCKGYYKDLFRLCESTM